MIGSTANSHATVVNLENMATFSAVPKPGYISTVTELVIHTTSADHQEAYTTIVIVPWLLATTSDLTLIMRFHHMGMDAKSELIHAIYHQLIAISDKHGHPVKQIQFIARIVTADKPLWVIDLIGPFGFSAIHLNHHFTGNSAGSSETIEFDGIPTQVLGGYGISNAPLPGYSHPPLSWANLPTALDLPLRYLIDILTRMGCEGIVSVLYAKAEPLRASSKHKHKHKYDRQSLLQQAHTPVAPTVIFRAPRHLKYFLDHFPLFMHGLIPPIVMGHAAVALPTPPTIADYRAQPVSLKEFMTGKTLSHYLSNVPHERHKQLGPPSSAAVSKFDPFEAATGILVSAKADICPRRTSLRHTCN
jgi:hypothetical protein